jgi:hypothetical protein
MTDGSAFVDVRPDGRNPDETRTIAAAASLSFVRPREGDSQSPPGRNDSLNANEDASRGLQPPHPLYAPRSASSEARRLRTVTGVCALETGPLATMTQRSACRIAPGGPAT